MSARIAVENARAEGLEAGSRSGRASALRDAAALIRSFEVEMRLTVLPEAHNGEVVVRDLKAELAAMVEGLGG